MKPGVVAGTAAPPSAGCPAAGGGAIGARATGRAMGAPPAVSVAAAAAATSEGGHLLTACSAACDAGEGGEGGELGVGGCGEGVGLHCVTMVGDPDSLIRSTQRAVPKTPVEQGIGRPALPPLPPLRLPPPPPVGLGAVSTARSPVGGAEAVEVEAPLDEARELRPLAPPLAPSEEEKRRGEAEVEAEAAVVPLLSVAERGRFQPLTPSSAPTARPR